MSDWLEQLSELEHLKASWERRETNSFQPYRKAVTDSASALIERARRAEELERAIAQTRERFTPDSVEVGKQKAEMARRTCDNILSIADAARREDA